ncbi:NUDIX hydrolase [Candidatus Phycosocius spiralis]|uniref:NUDIX hydrolase n=1 Tax=Candidatus Phycosocius spiralis TaxID=2815099 RepID=A0ABQ4PV54_9PROT|nr:NUDIX domain-containing protein [Candidatus Phycosocius spiralis]GIU66846.1 NUDIX hydrolase [Candidatus Phycosocius spiralis]
MTGAQDPLYPASTLLLVRDVADGLEVLMVERHANIGFAGGALVWPGGKVEVADFEEGWLDHADGLDGLSPDERAARIAAIRETFEETGVLLAHLDGALIGPKVQDLKLMRHKIDRDASLFLPLVRDQGLRLTGNNLTPFARWIPPPALHKRFDTRFYLARVPADQIGCQDGTEAVELLWIKPKAALQELAEGKRKIIFPTVRNLELLALSPTTDRALTDAAARPQGIVQPIIEDGVLKIRDDLGYPVTQERLESALRG